MIFSSCIESVISPTELKLVDIHKRDEKQNVQNYRPVSPLPIFGKIFERLIYNEMYSFFLEHDSVSNLQIKQIKQSKLAT